SGRAGDEEDAVGLLRQHAKRLELVWPEAQLFKVQGEVLPVEDAHHDAFAVHGRQGRHAEVDRVSADVELYAAVLGEASLRDVQVGHDLHARDHRLGKVDRRRHHFVQNAVHAVANLELVLEGLEVDVRAAVADRLQQDHVEKLDHGASIRIG